MWGEIAIGAWVAVGMYHVIMSLMNMRYASGIQGDIRMTGLPWDWMGWNTVFRKDSSTLSDGMPTYRLESYHLFGFFSIIGIFLIVMK